MNNYKIVTKAYCSEYNPNKYVDVGIYFLDNNDESNIMCSIMLNRIIAQEKKRSELYYSINIISLMNAIENNLDYESVNILINKNKLFKITKNKNKLTFVLNSNNDDIELSDTFNISILINNNVKEIMDMLKFLLNLNVDLTRGFR